MTRRLILAAAASLASACHQGSVPTPPTGPSVLLPPVRPAPAPWIASATTIATGETVEDRVEMDAPHCFPEWDTAGRCRAFKLTLEADGRLVVTVRWTPVKGEWDPDWFFVGPNGVWDWTGDDGSPRAAIFSVQRGATYHILVMSYLPTAQAFSLSTEMQ